ncbi:MAG: hypothetical protein Q8O76_03495 [Chloroflexota bacterium]|nr:hypothetical protein [Chloroflexota bacterium]
MKKTLAMAGVAAVALALVFGWALPALAQGNGGAAPRGGQAWDAMREACANGDWQQMAELGCPVAGDSGNAPCNGGSYAGPNGQTTGTASSNWYARGRQMGRGMMGYGPGGMRGSW